MEDAREITLDQLVEENVEENQDKKPTGYSYTGYNKEAVLQKLRGYCANNSIKLAEFCTMWGINKTTFCSILCCIY